MGERKKYIDNIRWITVMLVLVYHVIYMFNCSGVISNINVKGIPIMDTFLIFVYPWFMCLLFLVAGISSRYSLQKRTNKEYIKERVKKILLPSIAGMFIYGWISGLITNQYVDMFAGKGVATPGAIRYLIYSFMGIGPLWFCHVIFLASVLLVILRVIDKKDKLWNACGKANWLWLIVLLFAIWGSSCILNVPVISVYRFGIYFLMFLLGYYIFSHDEIVSKLEKVCVPFGIISFVIGCVYVYTYYGTNYTSDSCLQSIFTNVYLWVAILAILGLSKKLLDFSNSFTEYMSKNNYNIYILHYMVVVTLSYVVTTYLHLPFILNYCIILLYTIVILFPLIEIIKKIPVLRTLVFGMYKKK